MAHHIPTTRSVAGTLAGALGMILLVALGEPAVARHSRVLVAAEDLEPVRWSQTLRFAPGETWFYDVDTGVQSGTLALPYRLPVWNGGQPLGTGDLASGPTGTVTCGPGFIRFEAAGGVKECTLARDSELQIVWTHGSALFAAGKLVTFGYDSGVSHGTLARETTLLRVNGTQGRFPAGTAISFDPSGRVSNAVLPPGGGGQDGGFTGALVLEVSGLPLGYKTETITVPFRVDIAGGVLSGGADAAGPPGGYSLKWSGNVGADGAIVNGRVTGFVHRRDPEGWLRWTVTGPLAGRFDGKGGQGTLRLTTADGRTTLTGRWQTGPVPTTTPEPLGDPAAPGDISAQLPGTWRWVSGQTLIVSADGTCRVYLGKAQINACQWSITDAARRRIRLVHRSGGWIDDVTLSADGRTLDGLNNVKATIHGERVSGDSTPPAGAAADLVGKPVAGTADEIRRALPGTWRWVFGQTLIVTADGSCKVYLGQNQINSCQWSIVDAAGRRIRLVHRTGGWIDDVTLSADGRSLDGVNNVKTAIHGERAP